MTEELLPGKTPASAEPLGERERRILDGHDRLASMAPGPRERHIREQLGMAPVRYFQVLNALLDDPRALQYAPVTVNRLRRVRDEKRATFQ
ncbi:DUF3263 domain-containing protein [Streptomyces sp. cg35]|uniref:DUF3263 domain-containing protein n=1 Tax=Streptomyces sp. cg35 TaxID=3421650 RepID=UPI003D1642D0